MYKFILATAILSGCTDAAFSRFSTIGSKAETHSYCGANHIFGGISTGQIANEEGTDGIRGKFLITHLPEEAWRSVTVGETRVVSLSACQISIYED